ncbi:hypothetical protein BJV77DRAFT_982691 [Russula vinacea]|nr:hypothetical protein BJV77DRAFT_982691 [Russula vinacea]
MLDSLDVNIRISAKPPINSAPSHSAPSSPIPPSFPGGSVGSPSQSGPLTIEIPKPPTLAKASTEPGSPSSCKTAQSTPPSLRLPAAELSPSSPSHEPFPVLPTHPTVTPVLALPLIGPAVPTPICPISSGEVSREESAISGDPIPPQASIAEDPLSGPNVNIVSSWKVIDPTRPQHVHSKLPDPGGFVTTAPTAVTTAASPPLRQKRSWL